MQKCQLPMPGLMVKNQINYIPLADHNLNNLIKPIEIHLIYCQQK